MATRKVKLTDPQFAFLCDLVSGSRETTVNYPPAVKLVAHGLAVQVPRKNDVTGRLHRHFYEVTEAGRAHHEAVYMADKLCSFCKTAPWTCRVCRRRTCEHFCGSKSSDGTAICGRKACRT